MEKLHKKYFPFGLFIVALFLLGMTASRFIDDYQIYSKNVSSLDSVEVQTDADKAIMTFMRECYSSVLSNYTSCANLAETEIKAVSIDELVVFFKKTGNDYIYYAAPESSVWELKEYR